MKTILQIILLLVLTSQTNSKELIQRSSNHSYVGVEGIKCLDSTECYIAESKYIGNWKSKNRILISRDQGKTWDIHFDYDLVLQEDSTTSIKGFDVIDSNHIYLGMSDLQILRYTRDGGKTRTDLQFPKQNNNWDGVQDVVMIDSLKGIAKMSQTILRTFDGWKTYDVLPFYSRWYLTMEKKNDSIIRGIMTNFNKELDLPGLKYYVEYNINTNEHKDIYKFEDEYHQKQGKSLYFFNIEFVNDSVGFVVGQLDMYEGEQVTWDMIYKTTDGGKSWKLVLKDSEGAPFGLDDIAFQNESYGLAVAGDKIYETTDGGETWVFQPVPDEFDSDVARISFAGSTAIIAQLNGDIWTWADPVDTTSVRTDYSDKIKFIQKHNELLVSIKDETYKKYRLQIVDVMGRNMIDRSINSSALGNVFYPVDIKSFGGGSYYYSLSVGGEFVASGKFVRNK